MADRILLLAGNGFIGRETAIRLAGEGHGVLVHHTGRRAIPDHPAITGIVAERTPPPITEFPEALIEAAGGAVAAIHFYAMGREDGKAFVREFDGWVRRLVLISSCDVYRAYGRFIGTEPGPPDPISLDETAPLRETLYPYREQAEDEADFRYWYEKIEAERAILEARQSEVTILRLPKVYGPDGNADLATVYGFADQPDWRWTHGHVANVAAAIALAAVHPAAAGETFNLGEADTPTMGERLARLPKRENAPLAGEQFDCRQRLHFNTGKVRDSLGYEDVVDEDQAMRQLTKSRQ